MTSPSKAHQKKPTPEVAQRVGELIWENPGITTDEVRERLGLNGTQLFAALNSLTYICHVWEDDMGEKPFKLYIDYWFDPSFEPDDLFSCLFGMTIEDALMSMRNKPHKFGAETYDLGCTLDPEETRNQVRTFHLSSSMPELRSLRSLKGAVA